MKNVDDLLRENAERTDRTLEALLVAWRRSPELRLGQLIVNATNNSDPFCVTDEEMLKALKKWALEHEER